MFKKRYSLFEKKKRLINVPKKRYGPFGKKVKSRKNVLKKVKK